LDHVLEEEILECDGDGGAFAKSSGDDGFVLELRERVLVETIVEISRKKETSRSPLSGV